MRDLLHIRDNDWETSKYDPVAAFFNSGAGWHNNVKPKWDPVPALLAVEAPTGQVRPHTISFLTPWPRVDILAQRRAVGQIFHAHRRRGGGAIACLHVHACTCAQSSCVFVVFNAQEFVHARTGGERTAIRRAIRLLSVVCL